jgi:hypothetical protein
MRELVDDLRDAVIRDPNPWDETLYVRAADEIEQLRRTVEDQRAYAEQDACEIERLRVLGDQMVRCYQTFGPSPEMWDAVEAWQEARGE